MTQKQSGTNQPWPPQQPNQPQPGQPQPGQLPPGQAPYGTYSSPYQAQAPQQPYGNASQQAQPGRMQPPTQGGPNAPFGRTQPPSVSINDFKQPRSNRTLFLVLAVAAVVALLLAGLMRYTSTPTPVPAATPSVSRGATTAPEPIATGNEDTVPFTNANDGTEGTFSITDKEYTGGELVLHATVTITRGQQRIGFFALDHGSTSDYDPVAGDPDALHGRVVSEGETVTGTITFEKDPGNTTVFLTDSSGRQVCALLVKA